MLFPNLAAKRRSQDLSRSTDKSTPTIQTITPVNSFDPSQLPGARSSSRARDTENDSVHSGRSNGSRRSARSNDSRKSTGSNHSRKSSGSTGSKHSSGSKRSKKDDKGTTTGRHPMPNAPPIPGVAARLSRFQMNEAQPRDRRAIGAAVAAGAAGAGIFSMFGRFGSGTNKAAMKSGYADMESGTASTFQKSAMDRFEASPPDTPYQREEKSVEKAPVTGAATKAPLRVAKVVAMSLGILSLLVVIPAAGALLGMKSSSGTNFYSPLLEPESPTPSITTSVSLTPTHSPTPTHSLTPSPSVTHSSTGSQSISRTGTRSPSYTPAITGSPSRTLSVSPISSPSMSPSRSRTPSPTPSVSPPRGWFWWWPF